MSKPSSKSGVPEAPGGVCPICKKLAAAPFRPFCSRRCADLDLGRWLKGSYAIPAAEQDDLDEESSPGEVSHHD
jgi:endogenous inhibitor of DNA gyrase (YacG/DUF329 family)